MPRKRKEKTSFVMHLKFRSSLKDLTDVEYRELIEGMFDYTETRKRPKFSSRVIDIAFNPIQEKMDEDYISWKETCDNRSKAKKERDAKKRGSQSTTNVTKDHNCELSAQLSQSTANATEYEYDYDYDYDNELYNSVCNNSAPAREKPFFCQLGDTYKTEPCFNCKKRNRCPLDTSPDFKLKHPNETFYEWVDRKNKQKEDMIKEMKARGQPVNMELFDYDWLNEP